MSPNYWKKIQKKSKHQSLPSRLLEEAWVGLAVPTRIGKKCFYKKIIRMMRVYQLKFLDNYSDRSETDFNS